MAPPSNDPLVRCPHCGVPGVKFWASYSCPQCKQHNDGLYRSEHADPDSARTMTHDDIVAEYRDADVPMAYRPYLTGNDTLLPLLRELSREEASRDETNPALP